MPRRDSMDPLEIETHHVWSRVVQGGFLLGVDPRTKIDYSHRRGWVFSLHEYLASVLKVDAGSPNLLSNHLHDNLRSRPDLVKTMSDEEAAWRHRLAWPVYSSAAKGWVCEPTDRELNIRIRQMADDETYRNRIRRELSDISFFMARLKEPIAKMANAEMLPRRTGHFWDGPYGNRKLESSLEVVISFLYADLQQVKAGMADRLEDSNYSAIQAQIQARAARAFADTYEREAVTDGDHREIEQLAVMFANSWFSPIANDSPLMTQKEEPPASELVLPAGYYFEMAANQDAAQSKVADEQPVEAEPEKEPADVEPDEPCRRRRGRPRVVRPKTIHNRLRKKQLRRASRNSMLGLSWQEYFPLLSGIAERLRKDRGKYFPQPQPAIPHELEGVSLQDAQTDTAWTFRRTFQRFQDWLARRAQSAFVDLMQLCATMPRPPTSASE